MTTELTNHLWQSTVFAVAVGLLTAGFRQNRAHVRYWLWLTASFKFLLPFSLLMSLGSHLGSHLTWGPAAGNMAAPALSASIVQMSQPFPVTLPVTVSTGAARDWSVIVGFALWACGLAAVALLRWCAWRRVRASLRRSTPVKNWGTMRVRSSPGLLEPGVAGLFRPVLLLPEGIADRLTPSQLEAVLAHEWRHVRRRDNLTSAVHMIVEALFWFHPLVWWIGARLVDERERACDEAVLSLGNDPCDYAEGILSICRSYLESPLACVSSATGSNLKKRIQAILTGRIGSGLSFTKKLVLTAAGVAALAVPIAVGIITAPRIRAQSRVASPKFAAASVRPCSAFRKSTIQEDLSPETFQSSCTTVQRLIEQAYGLFGSGHMNPLSSVTVTGGPAWVSSDLYEIEAKTDSPESRPSKNGPMLEALLEKRFGLRVHRETRKVPVYELRVAQGGPKLQPFQGTCIPWDFDNPHPAPLAERCGETRLKSGGIEMKRTAMADLCMFFLVTLDRPVIDETGLAGRFNFYLELPTETLGYFHRPHGLPAVSDPATPATDPAVISAIKSAVQKLGLTLEPATGPGESIVIDHIERPSGD